MKFPRLFLQTFHFLAHYTCFPENKKVSPEDLARWLSILVLDIRIRVSGARLGFLLKQEMLISWGSKSAYDIKMSSSGMTGRCWLKARFSWVLGGCDSVKGLLMEKQSLRRSHQVVSHCLGLGQETLSNAVSWSLVSPACWTKSWDVSLEPTEPDYVSSGELRDQDFLWLLGEKATWFCSKQWLIGGSLGGQWGGKSWH